MGKDVGDRPPGQLTTSTVYRNNWMSVREDTFALPDGSVGTYGVVDKDDFSIVIAEADGTFHLVEQFRYPIGRRAWEFPMGTWPQGKSGSPLELARQELVEETGVSAANWRFLAHLNEAPGFCSQGFDVFHATDLTPGEHSREASEADMVHAVVDEAEFCAMILDGRIVDAATIAAYTLLRLIT